MEHTVVPQRAKNQPKTEVAFQPTQEAQQRQGREGQRRLAKGDAMADCLSNSQRRCRTSRTSMGNPAARKRPAHLKKKKKERKKERERERKKERKKEKKDCRQFVRRYMLTFVKQVEVREDHAVYA